MFSGVNSNGYNSLSGRKSTSLSNNLNHYSGSSSGRNGGSAGGGGGGRWSTMHDWMKIVRSPTRYRVGGNRFNLVIRPNLKIALMTASIILCFCFFYYLLSSSSNNHSDSPTVDTKGAGATPSLTKDVLKLIYEAYNDGVSLILADYLISFCII